VNQLLYDLGTVVEGRKKFGLESREEFVPQLGIDGSAIAA